MKFLSCVWMQLQIKHLLCLCLQVLWGPVTWHQKKSAFLHQWLHRRVSHSGLVGHLVYLPGHRDKRHHFRRPVGRRHGKHAGQAWARLSALFPVQVVIRLTSVWALVRRACWRVFWARRSLVGSSVCWLASLSPSSAAPVPSWSSNGCCSTSASAFLMSPVLPFSVFSTEPSCSWKPHFWLEQQRKAKKIPTDSVPLFCCCAQGQQLWLFGVPPVDRPVVGLLLPGPGGHRCQLLGPVLHPLHRGGLLLSHKLHLHLRCLQEDAETGSPLSHRFGL